jgi:hypothetical protein
MADTGHSGVSVPFSISKSLTGIFPYDSCTRLPSKLTSTGDKSRKVRSSVLAHDPKLCGLILEPVSPTSSQPFQKKDLGQNGIVNLTDFWQTGQHEKANTQLPTSSFSL